MKKIIKKIINSLRNNKLYVCTFLCGIIVISTIYRLNHVTPFGEKSLLCVDFFHQYGPMLGELHDRIFSGRNLIYSFNMALGLPFFRNFLNYLSSPFNIILLLFNKENLVTSYSFIIGIKAVSSCVTMVYYLSKKFKTKELYLVPLGLIYGFSAYFSAYYWNIMWLDGMVFVPLITLGIEYIVNDGKWKFYTTFLAIMLISNYFIGYMICCFSVVYFIFYLLYKFKFKKKHIKEEIKKSLKRCALFASASLLAGCLTAFLLLPLGICIGSTSATGGTMPTSQYYAFELVDYLKGHITGVTTTTFASDDITMPNISCGILSVMLLLLYIMNVDITMKNKICYLLILGFFAAAFFIPQLDYILQAFHVPNDLPYRYSFLYSFVLVTICAYSLINIKKMKFYIIALAYVFLVLALLSISQDEWLGCSENMIYINIIILTLYFIFYAGHYFIKNMNSIFYVSIMTVAMIDVIVSINNNWNITQVLENFYSDYNETENTLNYIRSYDQEKFYRIERTNMLTLNDGSWYNYYGMTAFSSMNYESMAKLQYKLGLPGNEINSYYYAQTTPVYDMMFDIKYIIGNTNDYDRYLELKNNDTTINEFKYNVGLAYGVKNKIKKWELTANPIYNQNEYLNLSTGIKDVFEEATLLKTTEIYNDDIYTILKYDYKNSLDNMYLYANEYSIAFIQVGDSLYYQADNYEDIVNLVDEINYSYAEEYDEKKVININPAEEEIPIYVGYINYYTKGISVHGINNSKFIEAYKTLNKNKYTITEFKENYIKGNITLDEKMDIYTSIPYDKGWHAYIDGKEVKTYKIGDALLGIKGTSGNHTLELKYKIPYFKTGLLISLISLTIMIFSRLIDRKKIRLPKIKLQKKKLNNIKREK